MPLKLAEGNSLIQQAFTATRSGKITAGLEEIASEETKSIQGLQADVRKDKNAN